MHWTLRFGATPTWAVRSTYSEALLRDLGAVLVVVSLLIHELGHAATATLLGVPVHGIGLKLVGAYTHRKYASRPLHDVIIAAAGPLSSLFLTVASFFVPKVGVWLAGWNLGIVVLNLLPFPGTDGYRILKTLFWPDAAIYQLKPSDVARRPWRSVPVPIH